MSTVKFTKGQLIERAENQTMKCSCHSYNLGAGESPEVILAVPAAFQLEADTVCIDACIANAILALWSAGLVTLNSCCGHNKRNPSIVIPQDESPQPYLDALAKIDSRQWTVMRWELVAYPSPGGETKTTKTH